MQRLTMQWAFVEPFVGTLLHQVYLSIHFEERPWKRQIKDIAPCFEQLGLACG